MPNSFKPTDLHTVRDLADKAENCEPLSKELNSLPFPERLQLAQDIAKVIETDRLLDSNLPSIRLETAVDSGGQSHLVEMQCVSAAAAETKRVTDIYNLPGEIDQMNVSLDVKLRLDRADTNNWNTGGLHIYNPPKF
ncbi:hypothetical protein BH10CYA1_BH10CYA1_46150 [soil metagenome]